MAVELRGAQDEIDARTAQAQSFDPGLWPFRPLAVSGHLRLIGKKLHMGILAVR